MTFHFWFSLFGPSSSLARSGRKVLIEFFSSAFDAGSICRQWSRSTSLRKHEKFENESPRWCFNATQKNLREKLLTRWLTEKISSENPQVNLEATRLLFSERRVFATLKSDDFFFHSKSSSCSRWQVGCICWISQISGNYEWFHVHSFVQIWKVHTHSEFPTLARDIFRIKVICRHSQGSSELLLIEAEIHRILKICFQCCSLASSTQPNRHVKDNFQFHKHSSQLWARSYSRTEVARIVIIDDEETIKQHQPERAVEKKIQI